MQYNTIVIGGGPAGLFLAQLVSQKQDKVLLIERNNMPGKKLMLSGSGQCNFTHSGDINYFLKCYGKNGKFLNKALHAFDNVNCMNFFKQGGIDYIVTDTGKVFPKSMKSSDILNFLILMCQKNNVVFKYNQLVNAVGKYDNIFTVDTKDGSRYFAKNIVIATGGKSYPKTGSDGIGYSLAEGLEHTIITPKPALTYVDTKEKSFTELAGLSFENAHITIYSNNKKVNENNGSLLFTHKGLSGPVILDASRFISAQDTLYVNFMYPNTFESVRESLAKTLSNRGKEEVLTFLKKLGLPKSFCHQICLLADLNEHTFCSNVTKVQREKLVNLLTRCPFTVASLGGFHVAMATCGGVSLKEVNPSSMESRKHKGLYFIGEVLDIDGNTGGYNIQAAFSTAYLCANHIINNMKSKK